MDLKRFVAPFSPPTTTLIDSLRYWTEQQPQEVAYYYTDGEAEETSLTYEQFDRHARAIAARLIDLKMTGERALLNLGHTFGHALETAAGFDGTLLHGEAVSLGITLAFQFSARRGLLPAAQAERAERHFASVGLPTRRAQLPSRIADPDRLMPLIAQDK